MITNILLFLILIGVLGNIFVNLLVVLSIDDAEEKIKMLRYDVQDLRGKITDWRENDEL